MNPIFFKTVLSLACLVSASAWLCSCSQPTHGQAEPGNGYVWERVIETGRGCFEEACTEGKWPMAIVPIVAFDNKLYSIGRKSVWISHDGITWDRKNKTDWGERHGMVFSFFDNKLWMSGGMSSWDKFFNDVWYSTDGIDWKVATTQAAWPARRNQSVVVFDGRMWLIGGAQSSGAANKTPTKFYNDVWSSRNGIDWTRVTQRAPWPARDGADVLVFADKLWMIGGEGHRDVWSSTNGVDWKQISSSAEWDARRGAGVVVFDNKMWLFGGLEHNDVWSSSDGKTWDRAAATAPWSTRGAEFSVTFRNGIWIYGGKTGRSDSWQESGDVWMMRADNRGR